MTRKWQMTEVFRGPVKFGYNADTSTRDITIYTHTTGSSILFDMSLDKMIMTNAELEISAKNTSTLALDAGGWCDIGYLNAVAVGGTPDTGAVRILKGTNDKWFLACHVGSGSYKYVAIATTSTV